MSRYLDPKADIVFKRIFGEHPTLLISFLNAVLPLDSNTPIVELSYLPSEQVPDIPEFKRTIADAKCKDSNGRVFIVEMQMNWTDSFKQRLLFGTSQAFVKQLGKGKEYKLLQPVYGLGIVADIYEKTNPEWYHHYQLVKKGTMDGDVIDHLQLIFIELPKFPIHSPNEKKLRLLWLRFLREIDEKTTTVSKELLDVPEIAQAIELAEESAYTPGELEVYQSYWDSVSRERTFVMDSYDKGLAKGLEKGLEKGLAKGLEKGLAKGLAQGITDGKIEIAKKMLKRGVSIEIIIEDTELKREQIEAINLNY